MQNGNVEVKQYFCGHQTMWSPTAEIFYILTGPVMEKVRAD